MSSRLVTRRLALVAGVALIAACAKHQPATGSTQAGNARNSRYVLTSVDLQAAGTQNVYDAIQKLRPEFLKQRGAGTITKVASPESSRAPAGGNSGPRTTGSGNALPISAEPIRVYENAVLMSGLDDLKRIDTKVVTEVRYVPGPEAAIKYGTNHSSGVIFVKTQ
jgi:hypothetical protein